MSKLTYRRMAEMLGFDTSGDYPGKDKADELVPTDESNESFVVGVDTNVDPTAADLRRWGGADRGQGRKVVIVAARTADVIAALHARLDAKPSKMIPQALARQALALLETACPYCGGFGYDKIKCLSCGWDEHGDDPDDEE